MQELEFNLLYRWFVGLGIDDAVWESCCGRCCCRCGPGGAGGGVDDASSWPRYIFRAGRGPEPWRTLAAVLLALLIAETVVAASRTLRSRRASGGQAP